MGETLELLLVAPHDERPSERWHFACVFGEFSPSWDEETHESAVVL